MTSSTVPDQSAQENDSSTFWSLVEEQKVLVVTLLGGLLLLGLGGLFFFNSQKPRKSNIEFVSSEPESSTTTPDTTSTTTTIVIDIAGAVVSPGVYELESEARVGEALEKAGGLAEKADKDWIAQNLNLAQKLSDGSKLYIPFEGEARSATGGGGMVAGVSQGVTNPQSGKININTASASELESLPGIGPTYAQKIIDFRTSTGRFNSPEDLKKVPGIGEKTFQKLKDLITVF